jgi:hypothetical protein
MRTSSAFTQLAVIWTVAPRQVGAVDVRHRGRRRDRNAGPPGGVGECARLDGLPSTGASLTAVSATVAWATGAAGRDAVVDGDRDVASSAARSGFCELFAYVSERSSAS